MRNTNSVVALILSCALCLFVGLLSTTNGDWRRSRKEKSPDKQAVEETYLDTLNRGREVSLGEAGAPVPDTEEENAGTMGEQKKVDGFRIQLIASTSLENLRAKKDAIASKLNMKIYIEHDEPYYKIYAGDFTQRAQADKALVTVKESGYPDAWIVKTLVFIDE